MLLPRSAHTLLNGIPHSVDSKSRIVIPSALCDFADLYQSGEAAVIGGGIELGIGSKRC